MEHEQHEAIARWERRWLNAAGLLLALFVILIAYSLATEGGHIAQQSGRTTPEQVTTLELFQNPGATIINLGAGQPTQAQVTLIAQAFSFNPAEIVLPVGAVTTFYLTSRDTIHGFQVQDTNINVMLIPGEISTLTYTFDKPGVYRTTCNEYCGGGHQNMIGSIRVLHPQELAEISAERSQGPAADATADGTGKDVYVANCAGCHQATGEGLSGTFPPVAGHAMNLFNADRSYLPKLLLYGLTGEISVGGTTYNGQMPAWQQLSDEEIASTLNHLLSGWEDDPSQLQEFEAYTAQDIGPLRDQPMTAADVHAFRQTLNLGE
jgi:cytochrome c oxidase subunit 2